MLFPIGIPVPPDEVVDREGFLEELERRLLSGESVILAAPRRTGKTSLAQKALADLAEEGAATGLVDVFAAPSLTALAEGLVDAVSGGRGAARRLARMAERGELAAGVDLGVVSLAARLGRSDDEGLLAEALKLPGRVASRTGRPVVIAFDEFQDVGKFGATDLLKWMRAAFQTSRGVSFLFLGSRAGMLTSLFSREREAFYRFALPLALPPVRAEAWTEYLRGKFSGLGFRVTPVALESLLRRSGGHPYDTMVLANEVHHVALEAGLRDVDADAVEMGFIRALNRLRPEFEAVWASLAARRHAQEVVERLAEGGRPYAEGAYPAGIRRALDWLEEEGLLERPGRGRWSFTEPFFAEFVRRR